MPTRKIKILLLGYLDTKMAGHICSVAKLLPNDLYDSRVVVLSSKNELDEHVASFFKLNTILGRILYKIHIWRQKLNLAIRNKGIVRIDIQECSSHFFSLRSSNPISAKQILDKHKGFVPDVIYLGWSSTLASPQAIKEMYDMTKATFVFSFVDEQYLTGGCHYPVDCYEYLDNCSRCPVVKGQSIASYQLNDARKNYEGIPKIVRGVQYDINKAKMSSIFKDALYMPWVSMPQVKRYSVMESREYWGIEPDEFVIFIGAQSLSVERKGFKYAVAAINIFAKEKKNVTLLALGANEENPLLKNISDDVKIKAYEYRPLDDMFKAYCAADCHLSPSIADSGPMMINYSVFLDCPVVCFNIGVVQDLVKHKQNGYIAEYRNSSSLAEGLSYVYSLDETQREVIKEVNSTIIDSLFKQRFWPEELYDIILKNERQNS